MRLQFLDHQKFGTVHAGLVARDDPAKWMLMENMLNWKMLKQRDVGESAGEATISNENSQNSTIMPSGWGRQKNGSYSDGLFTPESIYSKHQNY